MCFNAFGLGALNVYWIFTGLLFALLNALPFSTDCEQAMPSWLGFTHECTELESFLNLAWCIAIVGWGLVCAAVAALPKFVAVSAPVNKAAMLAVSGGSMAVVIPYLVVAFTMKLEVDGVPVNLAGSLGAFQAIATGVLIVAALMHREPTTGEKALL